MRFSAPAGRQVEQAASDLLMDRTGTLGVRMHRVERIIRTREFTEQLRVAGVPV